SGRRSGAIGPRRKPLGRRGFDQQPGPTAHGPTAARPWAARGTTSGIKRMDTEDAHAVPTRAVLRLPALAEPGAQRIPQRACIEPVRDRGRQLDYLDRSRAADG